VLDDIGSSQGNPNARNTNKPAGVDGSAVSPRLPSTSALQLLHRMSPSSTGDSPSSTTGPSLLPTISQSSATRPFPLPTRDNSAFGIEIPSPQLGASNGVNTLKSPTALKTARTPSFSRQGIMGSAQKARNLSQSSDNRPDNVADQKANTSDDDVVNPLKRRNTDAGVDYPRRRATIAVCPP
jgi:hypothetical protein